MKRITLPPRQNWMERVEADGFTFHTAGQHSPEGNGTYWFEGACYEFTLAEIDTIEAATEDLHKRCLNAVTEVLRDDALLARFVPEAFRPLVKKSWEEQHPDLYGRMDLALENGVPKLLEYNADTPTTLIETSKIQWQWLQDVFADRAAAGQQFNSLHEKLIDRFGEIVGNMPLGTYMHMSAIKNNLEEFATVEYLRDLAYQAFPRLDTEFTHMEDIGWTGDCFVDKQGADINYWFKLYPWEWLAAEEFGKHLATAGLKIGIIEPAWKMILSNKLILPVLWKLFPDHPNLLPAYFDEGKPPDGAEWVRKPALGREGGNISIVSDGAVSLHMPGSYDKGAFIYQKRVELPRHDSQHSIIGSWMVGSKPAGIIMREDECPIIINTSRVVPHYFTEE